MPDKREAGYISTSDGTSESGDDGHVTPADIISVLRQYPTKWEEVDQAKFGMEPQEDVVIFYHKKRRVRDKEGEWRYIIPTFVGPTNILLPQEAWNNLKPVIGPLYSHLVEEHVQNALRREQQQ